MAVNNSIYATYHAMRQQALALQAAANAMPVHPAYLNAPYVCTFKPMCWPIEIISEKRPERTITKKQKLQAFVFLIKALHSKQ